MENSYYIAETISTNSLSWQLSREKELEEGFVVYTDFQTAGRGQAGNSWESERGENLLFSILLKPSHIEITEHFLLSQIVSLGIKKILDKYTDGISIKWPNDIYWKDKKIVGILIENSIQNSHLKSSIAGIGLNVNQENFYSAPNAVSLFEITGKKHDKIGIIQDIRKTIMDIYSTWSNEKIRTEYMSSLYRKKGLYPFRADDEVFRAEIIDIHNDGKMDLKTEKGEIRSFYFKEVQYVL